MHLKNCTVLLTGGAGYIGSHTAVKLLEAGITVVVVDNCSNCYKEPDRFMPECLLRAQEITGKSIKFIPLDLLNQNELRLVFMQYQFDCVIHFSGLKSVSDSVQKPMAYFRNNILGSLNLVEAMVGVGCHRIIYSSSATVYGKPEKLPLEENSPTGNCTTPYGWTKYMIEIILSNLCQSDSRWKVMALRYFNPVGAHESGRIGEDPSGVPNNLMPYVAQVAVGKREELQVYGGDYKTKDGTGVRDYIHIQDLADAHVKALEKILDDDFQGFHPYNLGTGKGYSVLDVINAFEDTSGKVIPYSIVGRREGDVAESYCDCKLANKKLDWFAKKTLMDMCADMWRWQEMNPDGYKSQKACHCPEGNCTCKN